MRLVELEPQFITRVVKDGVEYLHYVDTLGEAEGIMFLCPVCFTKNHGNVGTHAIICYTPAVPADIAPGPGRWNMQGIGYDDLSLVAGSSSVALSNGCCAHFFIRNGEIVNAGGPPIG